MEVRCIGYHTFTVQPTRDMERVLVNGGHPIGISFCVSAEDAREIARAMLDAADEIAVHEARGRLRAVTDEEHAPGTEPQTTKETP